MLYMLSICCPNKITQWFVIQIYTLSGNNYLQTIPNSIVFFLLHGLTVITLTKSSGGEALPFSAPTTPRNLTTIHTHQ
jgi:hypothetical protein